MKTRILFVLTVYVFSFYSVYAQGGYTGPSIESLQKQLAKSNEEIKDAEGAKDPKNWLKRGELMMDIAEAGAVGLREGMTNIELRFNFGDPTEQLKETLPDGTQRSVYKYENIIVYLNASDLVTHWEQKHNIVDQPLEKAIEAFNKAMEYDEKGKMTSKVERQLDRLNEQINIKARQAYSNENYEKAGEMFALSAELKDKLNNYSEMVDEVVTDTAGLFNAALSYYGAEKFDKAAEYFQKSADLGYEVNDTYNRLYWSYIQIPDSAKALNALEEAINKVPGEINFLLMMIDLQIKKGNAEKAIEYIQNAKKAQPENEKLYYAEGTLWDQIGENEKAISAYKEALNIKPDYHEAYYGIGIVYYYMAKDLFDKAMEIKDNTEYGKIIDEANNTLKKAIEPFEKAHELAPEDKNIMEYLKALYVRFSMNEKLEEIKSKLGE